MEAEETERESEPLVRVKFQSSSWLAIFWTLAGLGLVAMTYYAYYRGQLLDLQSPVVETCVHHRLTQRVKVE
jgi:hypothetical protein